MKEAEIVMEGFRKAKAEGKELMFFDQLTALLRLEEEQTKRYIDEVLKPYRNLVR
jgi:hypothetical protein